MTTRAKRAAVPAIRDGLLTRLRRNTAGNVMMITAYALLPMTAMIGSGVDMARVYMVKSRLQQACDAGALAGRKYMTGTTFSSDATAKAQAFFDNNFPDGRFGTTDRSFTPVRTNDGQVRGTASVKVPMAVMQVFGYNNIDVNVACQARFEVSNTDVILVLDVTGSMADCPDNSTCNSGPGSKIEGIRKAVLKFYDVLAPTIGNDSRLRIGFVPYSSTVNMGIDPFTNTQLLQSNWLVDNWTYQSRVANMDLDGWTGTSVPNPIWNNQTFGTNISNANCDKWSNNKAFTQSSPSSSYTPVTGTDANTANSNPNNVQAPVTTYSETQPTDERRIYRRDPSNSAYTGNSTCKRQWQKVTTNYVRNGRFAFSSWDYRPVTYNVGTFKAGNPVQVYTADTPPSGSVTVSGKYDMVSLLSSAFGSTVTGNSTTFEGCVEERDTQSDATFTTPIPAGAWDLNVKATPTAADGTRWRPMWPELIYDRAGTAPELASTTDREYVQNNWCPVAASLLAVRTRAQVEDYVNDLVAAGNTFHDLGLAWGVRMITPFGMWAASNATAPNGKPINRHIIFMTDGVINTPATTYSSHAYEKVDRRVTGSGSTNTTSINARHTSRFLALCKEAEDNNNITMWTIAFGTDDPPALKTCAPDNNFRAANTAELEPAYATMAANIAKLRLSQ